MKIVYRDYPAPHNLRKEFFDLWPFDPEAMELASQQLVGKDFPRKELGDILMAYNQAIGNDSRALQNIERLRLPNSTFVITGQQAGFMGGPAYTILKAITCILLAREANAIPLFWIASEDHDVTEIDHTYLLDSLGNLHYSHLSLPKEGRPVEDLVLSEKCTQVLKEFCLHIKREDLTQNLSVGASYAHFTATILARLFSNTGLLFIEPRFLRRLAIPFFKREILEADAIAKVLNANTQQLEAAGGSAQIQIAQGTNLFLKTEDGYRRKIERRESDFNVGEKSYSPDELLSLVEKEPERFSTNVASRPVLQSMLFPTLAYVAGPSELLYYQQLKEYHHHHGVLMPWILPRLSATLIPPNAAELLAKCGLEPWNKIPSHWHTLMPDLDMGIADMTAEWIQIAHLYFDKDLSSETIARHARYAAQKIQKRVYKTRLHKKAIPYSALHYLRNLLHPHHTLQERVLNWFGFQADTTEDLVQAFLSQADWRSNTGHLYCFPD